MDWIRENKPLAVILGIIIAATLALGYFLFDSYTRYTESKDAFLALSNEVAGMKGAALAPTEENVKKKQALVEEFGANVNKLGTTLLILQPPPQPIKNIEFQAKLKTKVADIRKATGGRMGLPADFAFGFDDYTSNLPSDAASTELSGYLDAVDDLVKLFINSGVESVDMLERAKLPLEDGAKPAASQQPAVGANIMEKRQITVILTLDQGALQLVTSRLANPSEMPHFTSLRLLRVENQRQEGPPRGGSTLGQGSDIIPPPQDKDNGGNPGAAASDDIVPPPPAPPDSFPIIGQEKLKAYMEIDLVKFLDGARGVAVQTAPAPGR